MDIISENLSGGDLEPFHDIGDIGGDGGIESGGELVELLDPVLGDCVSGGDELLADGADEGVGAVNDVAIAGAIVVSEDLTAVLEAVEREHRLLIGVVLLKADHRGEHGETELLESGMISGIGAVGDMGVEGAGVRNHVAGGSGVDGATVVVSGVNPGGGCGDSLIDDRVDLLGVGEVAGIGLDVRVGFVELRLVHLQELGAEVVGGRRRIEDEVGLASSNDGVLSGVAERDEGGTVLSSEPWVASLGAPDVLEAQVDTAGDLGLDGVGAASVEAGEGVVLGLELVVGPREGEDVGVEVLELDLVDGTRTGELANDVPERQTSKAVVGKGRLVGKEMAEVAAICHFD